MDFREKEAWPPAGISGERALSFLREVPANSANSRSYTPSSLNNTVHRTTKSPPTQVAAAMKN